MARDNQSMNSRHTSETGHRNTVSTNNVADDTVGRGASGESGEDNRVAHLV